MLPLLQALDHLHQGLRRQAASDQGAEGGGAWQPPAKGLAAAGLGAGGRANLFHVVQMPCQ